MTTQTKSIFLVGANGSGKSTLAKQLNEKTGLTIFHAIKPANQYDAVDKSMRQYYNAPRIYDRSHAICRLVYQVDKLGDLERELLYTCAKRLAHDHILIHCTGMGERDIDKPHYDKQLIEETQDQEKLINVYTEILKYLPHQKYNFKINKISTLQLT